MYAQCHLRSLGSGRKGCVGIVYYQLLDALPLEEDWRRGLKPLVETESPRRPLPPPTGIGLEDDFLAHRVRTLFLHQGKDVAGREVLVHGHAVVQVLEARDETGREVRGMPFDIQSPVQQAAAVTARVVVGNLPHVVRSLFRRGDGS